MPYLIIDLEMSGNLVGFHDIIQIGAVLADDNWKKLATFESLVYPDNEEVFSSEAEEIHGIAIEDLEEAPSSFDVLEDLEAWVRKTLRKSDTQSLKDVVLCGQSVINDINFLKAKFDEFHIDWPFAYKLIDLLSISMVMYQVFDNSGKARPKSYSLNAVADFFGIHRSEDTHDALEDALMTYECFKKYFALIQQLRLP